MSDLIVWLLTALVVAVVSFMLGMESGMDNEIKTCQSEYMAQEIGKCLNGGIHTPVGFVQCNLINRYGVKK